jgi:hypothetical protein
VYRDEARAHRHLLVDLLEEYIDPQIVNVVIAHGKESFPVLQPVGLVDICKHIQMLPEPLDQPDHLYTL